MNSTQAPEASERQSFRQNRVLIYWILAAAVLRLLSLVTYPLTDMTEARYAEIARLMVERDDWVTLWFDDDVPFWGKPPLSVWMTAISFKLFGIHEFAARLPHWLAGLLVIWLVWPLAARRSENLAVYATALLVGSALFSGSAGFVMTDMAMLVGTTMAMRGFWLGLHGEATERQRESWLLFVGLGIGLLAKGPIAFVLSAAPIGLWAVFTGNVRRVFRDLPWVRGGLITLAMAAPWYVLAEYRTPGFLNYFLIGEHLSRFLIPGWAGDLYGAAHMYQRGTIWLFYLVGLLPWTLIFPLYAAWRFFRRQGERPTSDDQAWKAYLWLWALIPAIFFTFAGNILWPYVLPGFPALMLLVAGWMATDAEDKRVRRILISGLVSMMISLATLITVMELTGMNEDKAQRALIADYESRKQPGEILVYVGDREFSADFYSRGRARFVPGFNELAQVLGDATVYVAVPNEQRGMMPAELARSLRQVRQHGRYTLFVSSQ